MVLSMPHDVNVECYTEDESKGLHQLDVRITNSHAVMRLQYEVIGEMYERSTFVVGMSDGELRSIPLDPPKSIPEGHAINEILHWRSMS